MYHPRISPIHVEFSRRRFAIISLSHDFFTNATALRNTAHTLFIVTNCWIFILLCRVWSHTLVGTADQATVDVGYKQYCKHYWLLIQQNISHVRLVRLPNINELGEIILDGKHVCCLVIVLVTISWHTLKHLCSGFKLTN